MPDLDFEIVGAEVPPYAAVPALTFKMRIVNREDSPIGEMQRIHSIALRCQLQLAVTRRRYNPEEQVALLDVLASQSAGGIRCAICCGRMSALLSHSFQTALL